MSSSAREVTQLLVDWGKGDVQALDQLMPLVYNELHRIAGRYLRNERPNHTLQTTALINEAYVRIVDGKSVRWQDRVHFSEWQPRSCDIYWLTMRAVAGLPSEGAAYKS